jgi:recombinational DNA repair protein RecR
MTSYNAKNLIRLLSELRIKPHPMRVVLTAYMNSNDQNKKEFKEEMELILSSERCSRCGTFKYGECSNCEKLDLFKEKIDFLVIESPLSILNIPEREERYLFNLGGLLNYVKNIDQKQLRFAQLVKTLREFPITTVTLLLTENIDGKMTVNYTNSILSRMKLNVYNVDAYYLDSSIEHVEEGLVNRHKL